jgi:nitrite reductase/ring-hydroxylating ferredoxin subunit
LISLVIVYPNMGWIKVCYADSLSKGDLIGFDYDNKKILIAKVQDKIYATDGICTHEYADLSTGFLNEEEKTVILVHCICLFSN